MAKARPAARAAIGPIGLDEIYAARDRIAHSALRTPLVRLDAVADSAIYLKLENLQQIGSFKVRGSANAIGLAEPAALANGVYTASAGNMAQGLAWNARRLGIRCTVVVPEHAPSAKLDAVDRLGAKIIKVPFTRWWQILRDHEFPGLAGLFIHPFADTGVIAGNATIGLEIVEQLPDVLTVVVPYGGGGLSTGIASALKLLRPGTRVFAAEVDTAAPLAASLAAGRPVEVDYTPSWVDGIGGRSVLDEIWPLASTLLDGSITVPLDAVADALRVVATRARVVAEGAGAAAVAAALSGRTGQGPTVAVVSGGNIDATVLAAILAGGSPTGA